MPFFCYARNMALSDRQLLHSLSTMPFIDSAELALILGEPHATVHRALTDLLDVGGQIEDRDLQPLARVPDLMDR